MNFLIDTNIVIPLEPTSLQDYEVNTGSAFEFHRLSNESGNFIFIHPAIIYDIQRDKNELRKSLRKQLIKRYPVLQSVPSIKSLNSKFIEKSEKGTNEWVDNKLLAALKGDLVDHLVTEDIRLHKKAKKLGLEARVLRLSDAICLIRDFFDVSPTPPPSVSNPYVYEIDVQDPIFNSLRGDYGGDNFDAWLTKCKRERRKAFVVRADSGKIAGIVILKREDSLPNGEIGKILKICTFKVSERYSGNRYGELLLKPIFDFVKENSYEYAYFTAFPKQEHLISFANEFGFVEIPNHSSSREIALCKSFKYTQNDINGLPPLEFNIRFGPYITSFNGNKAYIVPILPKFYHKLFPDLGAFPVNMFSKTIQPCGNSIRKAYISHSPARSLKRGDNIFFYRSKDYSSLVCLGIVEETLISSEVAEVARLVGKRTVYSYPEIERMCQKSEVIAILFRFVGQIIPRITLHNLLDIGILKAQPQSITEMREQGIQWVRQQIKM